MEYGVRSHITTLCYAISMSRPLRLEFAEALYHVTSRGNRREGIYEEDDDRMRFLDLLGDVCHRFRWKIYAYCLMDNHYHLFVETQEGNLSRGMRHLNGVYTQWFNRQHGTGGHVFQGRYKAILVQRESYFLELARYVVLNPVRAGMAAKAEAWAWSSYRATVGEDPAPDWLDCDGLLANFGSNRKQAVSAYTRFVNEGVDQPSPWGALRNQIFLGDEKFVAQLGELKGPDDLAEISKSERQPLVKSLQEYRLEYPLRDEAMTRAYRSGAYTMKQIASFFSVHYMTVSRAVRKFENVVM